MMLEYDSTSAHGLRVPAPELVICSTAEVVYAISMQTLDSRFWASRARRTETIGLKSLSSFIYFYDHCLCDDFRSRTQHSKQTPFRVSNLEAARKSRLILDLILSFIQNLERFSGRNLSALQLRWFSETNGRHTIYRMLFGIIQIELRHLERVDTN